MFGSLLKQDDYGRDLTASIEDIDKCVVRVKDEADYCKSRQATGHGHMLLKLNETSSETNHSIQLQTQEINEQSGLLYDIDRRLKGQEDVLQAVYGLLCENMRLKSQLSGKSPWRNTLYTVRVTESDCDTASCKLKDSSPSRSLRAGYDAANVNHAVLDDDFAGLLTSSSSAERIEEEKARKAAVSRLQNILRYDPEAISRDVALAIREGQQLSYGAKSRGSALVNDAMFCEFMTAAASTSLLINGREDLAAADGISPLSLVVAEVMSSIGQQRAQVFPLSYFCNSRRPSRLLRDGGKPPDYAPLVEMAASLVSQLLSQMQQRGLEPKLTSVIDDMTWHTLEKLKVMALIKVLRELVAQLPPDAIVICAVDDVGEYETKVLSAKLQDMMDMLTRMNGGEQDERKDLAIFKLLVTCRSRALDVGPYFERTLDMAEEIEEDTSAEWAISGISR